MEILCALCRPHFLTDFFQILYRCVSQSNLQTSSFWWCCPQCSVFYRVKGHILVHIVCALTAAYFSGYLSCVRSPGHISWQISFACCIEVHYTLIYMYTVYDFGDAAPSVDNSPGHWRRSLYILLFEGRGEVCPSFEQKDDAKIAASAGGYIRIARQWRFLVYFSILSRKQIISGP